LGGADAVSPPLAVERAMQVKEVLLRTMNKEYSWLRRRRFWDHASRTTAESARWRCLGIRAWWICAGSTVSATDAGEEIERIWALYRER